MEFNGSEQNRLEAVDLHVRELGDGPAVVVLHGGPGAQHDYLVPSFGTLSDQFRLYFYDQRGGGRSRVRIPHRVSWHDHVADLDRLRQDWGLEKLTLLGYSWGGLLALLYASEYPASVHAMVLVAPAAGWGDYYRRFKEEFEQRSRSQEIVELRRQLEVSGLRCESPAEYAQRRFDLSVAGYFHDPVNAYGSPRFEVQVQAQQATWRSLRGHGPKLKRKLREADVPTLIVHGRHDPMAVEWVHELAAILPKARLVVLEDSAHVPHVEEADRTFAEIRAFLYEQLG